MRKPKDVMRRPKRSDARAAQRVMDRDLAAIRERWLAQEVDALLYQAYLDDPESGAYSLPLLADALGIRVIYLGEEQES